MKVNTNQWNKIRYTLYAPGYDIAGKILNKSRKQSIESLNIKPNDSVLIIGAGTGLDLEFLPIDCEIVATDITPKMIQIIKTKNITLKRNVQALVMDGQALTFPDNSFDHVILHLVISVIPDPVACIKEAERLVKPGEKIAIFDKFVKKNTKASSLRKIANLFTNLFFSDITRNFESIIEKSDLKIISDKSADLNGNFRLISLMKNQR